jgi:hypothetical protein
LLWQAGTFYAFPSVCVHPHPRQPAAPRPSVCPT